MACKRGVYSRRTFQSGLAKDKLSYIIFIFLLYKNEKIKTSQKKKTRKKRRNAKCTKTKTLEKNMKFSKIPISKPGLESAIEQIGILDDILGQNKDC